MNNRERGFEVRRATRASRVAVLVFLIAAVIVASLPLLGWPATRCATSRRSQPIWSSR